MATASTLSPSNMASDDSAASSIRGKRGVELWLETSSPNSSPKQPASPPSGDLASAIQPRPPSNSAPRMDASASGRHSAAGSDSINAMSMDEQLKLLKEKRRQRSTVSVSSDSGSGAAPVVPPLDLTKAQNPAPTTEGGGAAAPPAKPTGSAGKPPLSSRRAAQQLVHVPRSGRGDAAVSARAAVAAPPALPTVADIAKAVTDLNTGEWQKQTESLEVIKTALAASSSSDDPVRIKLRQQLHALVTGTLAAMDSQRSTVSKSATDAIGAIAQKLGNSGASSSEGNSLNDFVDPIVNKIVARGGSVSSRFLFDSAGVGLRELILATKAPKAVAALLSISPPPKVDRGRVLWCEGLTSGVENAPPGILTAKGSDLLVRVIRAAEGLVTDANGEVRECGKKLCQTLTQYCRESKENLRSIASKSLSNMKADHFLTFCVAVQSTDAELVSAAAPTTPATPGASATAAAPTSSRRAANGTPRTKSKSPPPPSSSSSAVPSTRPLATSPAASTASGHSPIVALAPQASGTHSDSAPRSHSPTEASALPSAAKSQESTNNNSTAAPQRLSPPQDAPTSTTVAVAGRRAPVTPLSSPGVSPAKADAASRSPQLEHFALANDSFGVTALSAATLAAPGSSTPREGSLGPGVMSPRLFGAAMSPRPGTNSATPGTDGVFGGTLARDMKEEHGVYSQSLFLAAEGTSADRAQALSNITLLLRKHLQDPATAMGPISNVATCFALCDVIALRCADTSNKVQVAALELVLPLFRCVPVSVVDATSPRWISCLSTALGSSYVGVRSAASNSLTALLTRSSESNLRNLCQTICMTSSTVRNVATKVELLSALVSIVKRHSFIVNKRRAKDGDDDILSTSFTMNSSASQLPGLTKSDLEFCTETALRVWCSDNRDEVRRADSALLCTLVDHAWDGEESRLLDNPRVDAASCTAIKAVLDSHRAEKLVMTSMAPSP